MRIPPFFRLLLALLSFAIPAAPAVGAVGLRDRACVARSADAAVPTAAAAFDCAQPLAGNRAGWTWLKAAPADLARLRGERHLLIDQARFEGLRVVARYADGTMSDTLLPGHGLVGNWFFGGHLLVTLPSRDVPLTEVLVGFDRLDHLPIMRKLRLLDDAELERLERQWLLVFGLFAGAVLSALTYNLSLHWAVGRRFRTVYSGWSLASLLYGASWTGVLFLAAPLLAGSDGGRLNVAAMALTFALGTAFFTLFLESWALKRWERRLTLALAAGSVLTGFAAAADPLFDPGVADRIWNLNALACWLCVAAFSLTALQRGSRAARFYLLAWSFPLAVVLLRIMRNFDIVGQSDLVDYLTFLSIGAQAVLLSVGIADRFRNLKSERDTASAEREEMRVLAETDTLTGLHNRRGFVARAQLAIGQAQQTGQGVALILFDIDHFKRINDKFGHDIGDMVLERLGETLRTNVTAVLVGRLGGEEFGVIQVGTGPHAALQLAEGLRKLVTGCRLDDILDGGHATASFGVAHASFTTEVQSFEQLYVAADRAMYRAKQTGRDRVALHETLDADVAMRSATL